MSLSDSGLSIKRFCSALVVLSLVASTYAEVADAGLFSRRGKSHGSGGSSGGSWGSHGSCGSSGSCGSRGTRSKRSTGSRGSRGSSGSSGSWGSKGSSGGSSGVVYVKPVVHCKPVVYCPPVCQPTVVHPVQPHCSTGNCYASSSTVSSNIVSVSSQPAAVSYPVSIPAVSTPTCANGKCFASTIPATTVKKSYAQLIVSLPADAKVTLQGKEMSRTGAVRTWKIPVADATRSYQYEIKISDGDRTLVTKVRVNASTPTKVNVVSKDGTLVFSKENQAMIKLASL